MGGAAGSPAHSAACQVSLLRRILISTRLIFWFSVESVGGEGKVQADCSVVAAPEAFPGLDSSTAHDLADGGTVAGLVVGDLEAKEFVDGLQCFLIISGDDHSLRHGTKASRQTSYELQYLL